jgi:hypothetical protein
MLTDLQKAKLTHYFRLLDFDNNGTIEEDDFVAIAENLCVLWNIKPGSPDYDKYVGMFRRSWSDFRNNVEHKDPKHATLAEWLDFADHHIVNGTDEFFKQYVVKTTEEIFDCFDVNKDGYIALDEYIDLFMAYHIQVRFSAKSYIKLDLNQDDLLSKEEMVTGFKEFFKSDDPNAHGNWLFGFWAEEGS